LLLQIWNWPIKAIFTYLKFLSNFKTFCQEHQLYFLSYHLGKKYSVSPMEHNKYRLTQNKAWQINKQKAHRRAFNLSQLLWINIYLVFICFLLHLAVYTGLLRLSLNSHGIQILNKLKSNKIEVNFSFWPPSKLVCLCWIFFGLCVLLVFRICQSSFITSAVVVDYLRCSDSSKVCQQ